MTFSADNLEKRKQFLTPEFYEKLRGELPTLDPFTRTTDLPKAFRAGACRVVEPAKEVTFNVLLFWKNDSRTEQRAITVDAKNANGKWLIDSVGDASDL